jgi:hypothetical protein
MPDTETMKRFESLLADYVDGELADACVPEFLALLEDADCQEALLEDLLMDARLAQFEHAQRGKAQFVGKVLATVEAETNGATFVGQVVGQAAQEAARPKVRQFWPVLVAAMFLVGLSLGIWLGSARQQTQQVVAPDLAPDPFVALLANGADVVFVDGFGPDGVRFQSGHYELATGAVHLRFANGADVVMRAPAVFDIDDAFHIRLREGRMRAIVPPSAHGFTIATPGVDYEDLGTEFALAVVPDGKSSLHVVNGRVDAKRPGSGELISSVTAGQSVQVADGIAEAAAPLDLQQYPTPGSIGLLRWQTQRSTLIRDPDLLAYYAFVEADVLTNEAADPVASDGTIRGARWVAGRWPGKSALLFDRDTDFVELDVPGEYEEMSFAAWLKIDRLDFSHSAIFNSNGWDAGDLHWQIFRSGPVAIGYQGVNYRQKAHLRTVPENQWIHVLGTLSSETGEIRVYVNGTVAHAAEVSANRRMTPGRGRLGNWLMEAEQDGAPIRSLRGKMDEFAIWKRALTEAEVKALVEAGKPSVLWAQEGL